MGRGFALCSVLGILTAGCASTGPTKEALLAIASTRQSSEQFGSLTLNSKLLRYTAPNIATQADYVIGPGDLLSISALDLAELERFKARVGLEGYITLPLVGPVQAKGLTARALERAIAAELGVNYLHDPQVSVFIEEYKSQRIAVLGEVMKPGVFEVNERRTVGDMLALAGGLTKDADQAVFVLRNASANNGQTTGGDELLKIDLEQMLTQDGVGPSLNISLSSGDVVTVPKAGEFFLGGAVKKPGAYPIKGKLTVGQAVFLGEGLTDDADLSQVQVMRAAAGSKWEILDLDLAQLNKEGQPGLTLRKNDVVYVGKSGTKAFLYGALDFFKNVIRVGISATASPAF